jgi:hypothetical protein
MRSDGMAARVYSYLSLMIGNAGPGRMQLPVYAARILQSPMLSKWRLEECLVYLLLAVRAIPVEDKRQLARLIKGSADPPIGDSALTIGSITDRSDGKEAQVAVTAFCNKEVIELDPPSLPNNTKTKASVREESQSSRSFLDASPTTGDAAAAAARVADSTGTGTSLEDNILTGETAFPERTSANTTGTGADNDITIVSPRKDNVEKGLTVENTASELTASSDPIDGSLIDEIVEEILMADKDYREEKLSAQRAANQKQKTESAAMKNNYNNKRKVSGELLSGEEGEEPVGRLKRLIVEPDEQTRLTCLLQPPPTTAKPPYLVSLLNFTVLWSWIRNFSLRIRIRLFNEFRIRILLVKSSGFGTDLFPEANLIFKVLKWRFKT